MSSAERGLEKAQQQRYGIDEHARRRGGWLNEHMRLLNFGVSHLPYFGYLVVFVIWNTRGCKRHS